MPCHAGRHGHAYFTLERRGPPIHLEPLRAGGSGIGAQCRGVGGALAPQAEAGATGGRRPPAVLRERTAYAAPAAHGGACVRVAGTCMARLSSDAPHNIHIPTCCMCLCSLKHMHDNDQGTIKCCIIFFISPEA